MSRWIDGTAGGYGGALLPTGHLLSPRHSGRRNGGTPRSALELKQKCDASANVKAYSIVKRVAVGRTWSSGRWMKMLRKALVKQKVNEVMRRRRREEFQSQLNKLVVCCIKRIEACITDLKQM